MSEEESFCQPSRKYKKISYKLRMKLIEMVEKGETYFQAGKKLGISPSTAKMIVLKFQSEGKIFEKKKDKHKRAEGDANSLKNVNGREVFIRQETSQVEDKQFEKKTSQAHFFILASYLPFMWSPGSPAPQ